MIHMRSLKVAFALLWGIFFLCKGQEYQRFEASYSIKEQLTDKSQSLQIGKVYYNSITDQICYDISFPRKERVIVCDTFMITVGENGSKTAVTGLGLVSFSIFSLLLKSDLSYYGLKKLPYKMLDIHNEDTLVISKWQVFDNVRTNMPVISLAQCNKRLYSFVGFDRNDNIVTRQFYENYETINGLSIPTQVITFYYINNEESIKWLILRDIRINNFRNDENYVFSVIDFL